MRTLLIAEIDDLETELRSIDQRRVIIDAQLSLLRRLVARLDEASAESSKPPSATVTAVTPHQQTRKEAVKGSKLSDRWSCVVKAAIERYPDSIEYNEVPQIQLAAGQEPGSREQIRTHVWVSTRDGLYEKINRGAFRATATAAEVLNLPLGSGRQAPDRSPNQESEAPNSDELFGAPQGNGAVPLHT